MKYLVTVRGGGLPGMGRPEATAEFGDILDARRELLRISPDFRPRIWIEMDWGAGEEGSRTASYDDPSCGSGSCS